MTDLNQKAFGGLFFLIVVLALMIFLSAGTIHYWQAWVFLTIFSLMVLAITLYLMKKNPALLERRVYAGSAAEKETSQKIIQFIAQIAFITVIIFPAIDHRFCWSIVPIFIILTGDALVVLGLYLVFLVFKANSFTSAIIEVGTQQKVISTGPYAIIRHPMYASALVMLFGVPLALGSWWGILTIIPITLTIVCRLLEEEKFLDQHLPGYKDYRHKIRYRLFPFIW